MKGLLGMLDMNSIGATSSVSDVISRKKLRARNITSKPGRRFQNSPLFLFVLNMFGSGGGNLMPAGRQGSTTWPPFPMRKYAPGFY